MSENIYQFNFSQLDGEEVSLSKFKGKADSSCQYRKLLWVNLSLYWARKTLQRV